MKHIQEYVARLTTVSSCEDCDGTRLAEAPRTATVHGTTIGECSAMQVSDLTTWLDTVTDPETSPVVAQLRAMLENFVDVGLGYLSLDREVGTVSGGEAQRVKMIRHLGSALTDVTYVVDEPATGPHAHDITRMNRLFT